jgi:TonB family protein
MIKTTIVVLAAWLLVPRLRRRSAAERHALWAAALAVAATLPLLSLALPSWQPAWARRAADVWPAAFETVLPAVTTAGDIVIRATGVESGEWPLLDTIGFLWALGAGLALVILAGRALQLDRLTFAATQADDERLAIAKRVAVSLGLTTIPRVHHSPHIAIPLAWGIRRPRILLPDGARAWSDERIWSVCAHELAHIVRGDWPIHVLAEVICRIYWFHPLFWVARNHLRRESERAADDVVIGLGAEGADYASHLVEIVKAARQQPVGVTVAMARRSELESRVTSLLNALANRARLSRGRGLALLIGTLVVAFPLAALTARGGMTIEIRTSNLPPLDDAPTRDTLADDGEPLRRIRLLSGATTPPEVEEYTTPPLYSDEARRRGIEGRLVLRARIESDGRVSEARVAKGLGFGLDQNALVALRQWRFRPGTRDGSAVASDVELEIEFTLRHESINAQIANDMVSLVGPGVTPPRAVRVVSLRPRRTGSSGTVVLDVVLLEDGTPRIVRILQSLGPDIDDVAVSTFEQWRFSPALKDGRPIKVRMNAEVKFHG